MLTLLLIPAFLVLTTLAGFGAAALLHLLDKGDPGPEAPAHLRWPCLIAFGFTAGCAFLSLLFAIVGHLVIGPVSLTLLALPLSAAGVYHLRKLGIPVPKIAEFLRLPLAEKLILVAIAISATLSLGGVLTPEVRHDPLFYHVQVPQLWLNTGRMVEVPENGHSYFPYGFEMMYTWALAFGDDSAAKAFHWAAGLAAAAWVMRLASLFRAPAIAAGGLFYFIPTMTYLSTTTYIDLGTAMYALGAVAILWAEFSPPPSTRSLVLVGLFTGSAMATKYTAWPLVGVPLGVAVLLSRPRLASLVACGVVTFAPLLPWVGRNIAYVGNPLAPLMIGTFGPAEARGGELHGHFDAFAGQESGIGAILAAPFAYLLHLLNQKYTLHLLGLLAALGLVLLTRKEKAVPRWNPGVALILVFVFAFLCEAFFTRGHPDGRYGLMSMGLAAALIAALCARLGAAAGGGAPCHLAPLLALAMFASALPDYLRFQNMLGERWLPIVGAEQRMAYRLGKGTVPADFVALEELLLAEDAGRVAGMVYPSRVRYYQWITGMRNEPVRRAGGADADPWDIATSLQEQGFTHVLNSENPGFSLAAWRAFLDTLPPPRQVGNTTIHDIPPG